MMSADDDINFLHNIKCEPELDIDGMSEGTTNSSESGSQMHWPRSSESPNNFDYNLVSMLEPEIDLNEPPVHLVMRKAKNTNDIPMNNNLNIIKKTQKEIPILNIPLPASSDKQQLMMQRKNKRGNGQPKSNAQMMREYRRRRKEDPVKYAEYLQRERIRNAKRKRLKKNQGGTVEEMGQNRIILDTEMCRKALSQNGVEMSVIPKLKTIQTPKTLKPTATNYTLDDLLNDLATESHNNGRISRTLNAIDTKLYNQNNASLSVKHQAPSLSSTKMASSAALNMTAALTTPPATTSRLRVRSDLTSTKEVTNEPNILPSLICNSTIQSNNFNQISARHPQKIEVPIMMKTLTSPSNKSTIKKPIHVHKKPSTSPPPLLPLPGFQIDKFKQTPCRQIKIEPIEIKTEIIDLDYGDINGLGGGGGGGGCCGSGDLNSTGQGDILLNLPLKSSPSSSPSTSGKTQIRRANAKSTTTVLGETASVSRNSGKKSSPVKPHFLDSFLEYVADKVDERKVFDYLRPKNTNL